MSHHDEMVDQPVLLKSQLPKELGPEAEITVYGPSVCPKCEATMAALAAADIDHAKTVLDDDPQALAFTKQRLGAMAAPVVTVEQDGTRYHWSTHRPDLIQGLAKAKKAS